MQSALKPLLLIALAFLCQTAQEQAFTEILGRPGDSSVTVSILFDRATEIFLEYGADPGSLAFATGIFQVAKDTPLEVDLVGLQPGLQYYYRTRYRIAGTSAEFRAGTVHSFHTCRAAGSTFTFTIEADEHLYDKKGCKNLYQVCLGNQADDHPDFMFSLGDIFGDDHHPYTITSADMDKLHKDYRPFLGSICHSVPLFICLGNHEGEKDFYLGQSPPGNIAVYATQWRKFYYPNPFPTTFYSGNSESEPFGIGQPENYYAWTWCDALFVVLDAYRYDCDTSAKPVNWAWTLGFTQYSWLKNTLEASHEKYKFVFAHHTRGEGRGGVSTARFFEWGGYEANGTTWGFDAYRPGWGKPIHQLFVDNGVDIFFQGHDHLFSKEVLDGVVYQEVPMPSDSTYSIGMLANAGAYLSDTLEGSGHLKVTVSPSCAKVDFIRAYLPADTLNSGHHNREVAFTYTIGTCSSQGEEDHSDPRGIDIYPNPASSVVYISAKDELAPVHISMVNTVGQTVLETQSKTLDVSTIRAGIYFLNIRTRTIEINRKLCVSR